MPGVLAAATFRKRCTCQISQPEGIVEFAVRKQPSVRGDPTALKLQLQAAVEINPDGAVIRFTRWVSHACSRFGEH
jgi:hypothetical protein